MKKLLLVSLVLAVSVVSAGTYIWFIWLPQQNRALFENHYLSIARKLNSTESKAEVISWFGRDFNFTELYEWVHEKLDFVPFNETFERHTDPSEILESGKGRCEEFSILYVAACLAQGYQSRIIVAIDTSNPVNLIGQHVWAEVKLDNCWVHVDPSEQRWNETNMYQSWEWGEEIGLKIAIYAFEEGRCEEVTLNYGSSFEVLGDEMNITPLSLVDLLRNISLALFAITTWYIRHEERRTRLLLSSSLTIGDPSTMNLAEIIIELRDKEGLHRSFGKHVRSPNIVRLQNKLDKLKRLDLLRTLSVTFFAFFVILEIVMVAFVWLSSF